MEEDQVPASEVPGRVEGRKCPGLVLFWDTFCSPTTYLHFRQFHPSPPFPLPPLRPSASSHATAICLPSMIFHVVCESSGEFAL